MLHYRLAMRGSAGLFRVLAVSSLLGLLSACGDSDDLSVKAGPPVPPPVEPIFSAQLRRTEYGIPHITADDWGSLGYGFGVAYAQDNYCVTMREIVFGTGRSAELMGEDEGKVDEDFLFRYLNGSKDDFRARYIDPQSQDSQDLLTGFTAGMNRYLRDTGVENLAEGSAGCRNAPWVFEIDAVDLLMYLRRVALGGSSDQGPLRRAIIDVNGPDDAGQISATAADWQRVRERLGEAGRELSNENGGSNAIGVGRDASQTGTGILLGNPHQPWNGSGRWYQVHLTVPGEYDVAGATLQGIPFVGIGFNRDIAWTHTVSVATRFTLYELQINPDDPLQYRYEDAWRDITPQTVSIDVKLADGSLETRERVFYNTHFGPVINAKGIDPLLDGWPLLTGTLLVLRDANLDTSLRTFDQYRRMGQSTTVRELAEAMRPIGNPNFHTIAVDRNGEAFYVEAAAIPHVTQAQIDSCIDGIVGQVAASQFNNAFLILNGSRAECEWGEDPDSPPGTNLYGLDARPKLFTTDYVGNSNNSYWLSDANNPLTGFPFVFGWIGHENQQQFLRTRINHLMVAERKAGSDGLSDSPGFTLQTLQGLMYANRVHGAELVLDDMLAICAGLEGADAAQARAQQACAVLADWDRKVNVESRGAQVFHEFWRRIRAAREGTFTNVVSSDEFWKVDFDAADPLKTPRGIDIDLVTNRELVVSALSDSVLALEDAGVALDAPWGEVQFYPRNGENIPIHGGAGTMGVFGAISVGLDPGGYFDISGGSSYIQTVTWDETDCPIADTILTHSQSSDPASDHYGDQTRLFSRKEWVSYPYCEEAVVAAQIGDTELLEE